MSSGPIKAQIPASHFMQTINDDDSNLENPNVTPLITKSRKPPLTQKVSTVGTKTPTRAQSVDGSNPLG